MNRRSFLVLASGLLVPEPPRVTYSFPFALWDLERAPVFVSDVLTLQDILSAMDRLRKHNAVPLDKPRLFLSASELEAAFGVLIASP